MYYNRKINPKVLCNMLNSKLETSWHLKLTESFRRDSALRSRIDHPVVIFQRVYSLQHSADPPHAAVDVSIGQEVRRQVAVQPCLHCRRCMDPQRGVEEDVV